MKKWYLSKTLWVQFLATAIVVFSTIGKPEIGEWIKGHLVESSSFWAVVNIIVRKFTNEEVA